MALVHWACRVEGGGRSRLSFGLQRGGVRRSGGHLCQGRLLEHGRLESLVWDGGAAGDGGAQQGIQVGAAAEDGGGGGGRRGCGRRGGAGVRRDRELLCEGRGSGKCVIEQPSKLHVLVVDKLEHVCKKNANRQSEAVIGGPF